MTFGGCAKAMACPSVVLAIPTLAGLKAWLAHLDVHVSPDKFCHVFCQAFRQLAREHHPDKGGDARRFAALRSAVAVLGDPAQRRVYDALAAQTQWRYVPRSAQQPTVRMIQGH